MKRVISLFLAMLMLSSLCACKNEAVTDSAGYETPEALVDAYLHAVATKDYGAIWDMIPPAIQDYAIKEGIIKDEADGLDYIKFAVNDYHWLFDANLPAQESYSYEIGDIEEATREDLKSSQDYINADLEPPNNRLVIEADAYMDSVTITLDDGSTVDGSFWAIKTDDQWYITSVVGQDVLFDY